MFGFLLKRNKASNLAVSQENFKSVRLEFALKQLSVLEKSLQDVVNHSDNKNLMFLEDIDLIKALDAIVYTAKIDNKLCNIKEIIENIETAFGTLKCTQDNCSETATMCLKFDKDTPAELYCKIHSNEVDPIKKKQYNFDEKLSKQKFILNYLEKLLIVVQEQVEYILSENANIDQIAYSLAKDDIDSMHRSLTIMLNDMTQKSEIIAKYEPEVEKPINYESLSSIKVDSKNCVKTVLQLLSLVFEINLRPKVESKVKAILKWSKECRQSENAKVGSIDSIPDDVYGQEIELCKTPTQSLKTIEDSKNKMISIDQEQILNIFSIIRETLIDEIKQKEQTNFGEKIQNIENNQKIKEVAKEENKEKEQPKIDKEVIKEHNKEQKESENVQNNQESKRSRLKIIACTFGAILFLLFCVYQFQIYIKLGFISKFVIKTEEFKLRSDQFYKDNMKVIILFDERFAISSEEYNKLKAFEYNLTDFDIQSIQVKTFINRHGWECVGVGQFTEGINGLHGVGIQVDSWGDIQEGYWNNGYLNGQGRRICGDGYYYIGEFENEVVHGQGTWHYRNGTEKLGKWNYGRFVG